MGAFNMPPGCSPSDIPGNRPEDMAWEDFSIWATDELADPKNGLTIAEAGRAVLIGIAAVKADRDIIQNQIREAVGEALFEERNKDS